MKRAFLTGATGFLGLRLAAMLQQRGWAVRALVRPRPAGDAALQQLTRLGVECVTGDLDQVPVMRSALVGTTHVFHLAGKLLIPGVPEAVYAHVHIDGTRQLLEACAHTPGLHAIVHCSTTGVLGPTGPYRRDEHAPLKPSNPYERTKAMSEQVALEVAARFGLPVVVARPGLVYGPGDRHLVGWFKAIQQRWYRVIGDGANMLHPIYIDDLVEALIRCAEQPAAIGRIYHLVGDAPLPISDLAAAIAQALNVRMPRTSLPLPLALGIAHVLEALPGIPPERLPLTRSRVTFMTQSRAYSGDRARRELGFAPQVTLHTGLKRTVAWYRAEGLL